jgi:hypothetical protein
MTITSHPPRSILIQNVTEVMIEQQIFFRSYFRRMHFYQKNKVVTVILRNVKYSLQNLCYKRETELNEIFQS